MKEATCYECLMQTGIIFVINILTVDSTKIGHFGIRKKTFRRNNR